MSSTIYFGCVDAQKRQNCIELQYHKRVCTYQQVQIFRIHDFYYPVASLQRIYTDYLLLLQYLAHYSSLSIMVGIRLWVQLIHQTRLLSVDIMAIVTSMTMFPITISQRRSASGTVAPKNTTCGFRFATEGIGAFFTTRDRSALALELIHGDGRELGGGMVLGFVLVNLVYGNGGVDDGWLNGLLLNDGLDVLVDVVVHMLSCDSGVGGGGMMDITDCAGILELSLFSGQTFLDLGIVSVVDLAVLNTSHLVGVHFWKNLLVLDRLNGSVVVVLVDLAVYDRLSIIVL